MGIGILQTATIADTPAFGGSRYVKSVLGREPTFYFTASLAAPFSSKTSLIPGFVTFTLTVGVACPNCSGHTVPLIALRVAFLPSG